jgi:hypothetical protein
VVGGLGQNFVGGIHSLAEFAKSTIGALAAARKARTR